MRAVFLDRASIDLDDLDLRALREVLPALEMFDRTAPEQTLERVRDADVVILNKVVLDASILKHAPGLRLICIVATGTDNVDVAAARAGGAAVCNVRGYGTASVAQHTIALVLALHTRMLDYHLAVQRGDWQKADQFCLLDYPIQELCGRRLGIVGFGTLGQAVAKLAQAFEMEVLVAQRPGRVEADADRLPLAELLPKIDVLTMHCPLTQDTRHLIGPAELALMPPGAFLINTARGGIVDEAALAEALRSGHLGGAGVDVLSTEPPRQGNPLLQTDLPNLIVTPHCAWGSKEARQRVIDQLVENVTSFQAGELMRSVG